MAHIRKGRSPTVLREIVQQCGDLSGHDGRKLAQPTVEVGTANLVERHTMMISLLMTIY
jgi:hypothetical protein